MLSLQEEWEDITSDEKRAGLDKSGAAKRVPLYLMSILLLLPPPPPFPFDQAYANISSVTGVDSQPRTPPTLIIHVLVLR